MQHVYALLYPNRLAATAVTEVGSTVADVQAPHSQGYSTAPAVQGILLLKTLRVEHGLSGEPQRQVTLTRHGQGLLDARHRDCHWHCQWQCQCQPE
jgi:hypothetical protein